MHDSDSHPVVFFGSGAFGVPTLERLAAQGRVVGVVTQPDKPAGRGGNSTPTPIAQWVAQHLPQVPLLKPVRCSAADAMAQIRALPASDWVVIAFGQKLSQLLLADRFAINLHASLLPRWRGAAPIHAAMLAGDSVTGNSVITLADKMDAGLVLGTTTREISSDVTVGELHDLLAGDGPDLVERVLREHHAGTLRAITQDESLVTLASKLDKATGWVDFTRPARECRQRVHGLTPWPGVSVRIVSRSSRERVCDGLKVLRVRDERGARGEQGSLDARDGLIACGGDASLRLLSVQPAGKKPMSWGDFARGRAAALAQDCLVESEQPVPGSTS